MIPSNMQSTTKGNLSPVLGFVEPLTLGIVCRGTTDGIFSNILLKQCNFCRPYYLAEVTNKGSFILFSPTFAVLPLEVQESCWRKMYRFPLLILRSWCGRVLLQPEAEGSVK